MSIESIREEKLAALVDWMALRQIYPERRVTLVCWAEVNWPDASDSDIDYLWDNFGRYVRFS